LYHLAVLPKLRFTLLAFRIFVAGCALLIASFASHEALAPPSVFLVDQ